MPHNFLRLATALITKGKQQLKWNGKVQEVKEFVTLVLKASGSWSTKKYAGKVNQHIFQEKKKSYTINFWPSKKTLTVQGNGKNGRENKQQN